MKRYLCTFTFLIFLNGISFSQTLISGKVLSVSGAPLGFANVILIGTTQGAMTDEGGTFSFSTLQTGPGEVQVSLLGYEKKRKKIRLEKGKKTDLVFHLTEQDISLSELVVTASAYGTETVSGLPVSPMEVVTTPGGAADIFQMLKTLPGLTPVSESSDLFIRGGDPMESCVLADQSVIDHPGTFESTYGGLFSVLPPSMVKSLWFSSGGFPAKYGNALSGILDITTRQEPSEFRIQAGANFAGWDAETTVPVIPGKSGLTAFVKASRTGLLMKVNQNTRPFTSYPEGWTAGGSYSHRVTETGRIKLNFLAGQDNQGVLVSRPEGKSEFTGQTETENAGISWSEVFTQKVVVKTGLSVTQFSKNWKLGVLDLLETDQTVQARTDVELAGSNGQKWYTGFSTDHRVDEFTGRVPASDHDYRTGAAFRNLQEGTPVTTGGGYLEWEQSGWFGVPALSSRLGIRADHSSDRKSATLDPRLSLSAPLTETITGSLSAGIYHQSPWLPLQNRKEIRSSLPAMSARHLVGSLAWQGPDAASFRAEFWGKHYRDLPKKSAGGWAGNGTGYALGTDLIYKGLLPGSIDGWISYGWSISRRDWLETTGMAPSQADITHNLTWIGKKNLTAAWQIGWNLKLATGRPYTPVTGSQADTLSGLLQPVFGETNSARLPVYHRLDLRLTWTGGLFDRVFLVGYAEILNCLDTANPMGYTWNSEYTQKSPVQSYFGNRTLVLGFSATL